MRLRQIGLIGAAIAFARSERGQRLIVDARRRYDTPENRAKISGVVQSARKSLASRSRAH